MLGSTDALNLLDHSGRQRDGHGASVTHGGMNLCYLFLNSSRQGESVKGGRVWGHRCKERCSVEWVCGLEDLDVNDRALAGGKGANLGAMVRAGLPVPGGFVVLTAAYREFVEHNRLRAEIEQIAAAANGGDVAALEKASDALRALFERGAIPPELEGAITGGEQCPSIRCRGTDLADCSHGMGTSGRRRGVGRGCPQPLSR